MNQVKLALFVFLAVCSHFSFAQMTLPLGINVSVGKSYYTNTNVDFENFRMTYNEANASVLDQTMAPVQYNSATYWSIGVIGASIGFDFIRARHEGSTKAVLSNGASREFRMVDKTSQLEFSFSIPFKEYFSFGVTTGAIAYNGTIYSGFRYPSGNLSYGIEKRLNGIYYNEGHDIFLGFKVKAGYKYGFAFLRCNWYGMFYKRNEYNHELGWKDEVDGGTGFYDNYDFPTFMADDYNNINDPNITVTHVNDNHIGQHAKGRIVQVGISFYLGFYFDDYN